MKKYRAVFLAGDATLCCKDFCISGDIRETSIIIDLLDTQENLKDKYNCPVSVRVDFLGELIVPETQAHSRHSWLDWVIRRVSSFFGF